jgi:hypothetical protein
MAPEDNGDAAALKESNYASLGILAVGAPALEIWRKEDDVR